MSMNMKKHLRCILLLSVFFMLLTISISYAVYKNTKSSYKKVGHNQGSIQTKLEVIEKVRDIIGVTNSCHEIYMDNDLTLITFISVKSSDLYIVKDDNGLVGFCLSE
jgi:hypothetical protein